MCLGAGQDPIPAVLEYTTHQISLHWDVQARLRQELTSLLPPWNEARTYAMVDTLPYLNAVVLEGLRLVDTIESYQRRVVPKNGCVVEGYYLPAGVSGFAYISSDGEIKTFPAQALTLLPLPDSRFRPAIPHQSPGCHLSRT